MNISKIWVLLAKVAQESGYEKLWTSLTTSRDELLLAIGDDDIKPAVVTQIEKRLTNCRQQLRAAAENDLMAQYLSHMISNPGGEMTFSHRFGIARRLRQMAARWNATDPETSETACQQADEVELELEFHLYLDTDSTNALAQQVCDLGGVVIPNIWRGWPFPRLTLPLPSGRTESAAEIEARWVAEDHATEGWEQAVMNRLCNLPHSLSFWFPQVISEDELDLPVNRVRHAESFPDLFTSIDWPMIQFQNEGSSLKHASIVHFPAGYQSFRYHWNEEDFTTELKADFRSRLTTLREVFVRLHEWCEKSLVQVSFDCFCAPTIWNKNEKFRNYLLDPND